MVLWGIVGERRIIDQKALYLAATHVPSLVIDCANVADPHRLRHMRELERLNEIHVIELELLYKFRDVMKRAKDLASGLQAKAIIITTSDHLFNYHDKAENEHVLAHAWELIEDVAKAFLVIVALKKGSKQVTLARKHHARLRWVTP